MRMHLTADCAHNWARGDLPPQQQVGAEFAVDNSSGFRGPAASHCRYTETCIVLPRHLSWPNTSLMGASHTLDERPHSQVAV